MRGSRRLPRPGDGLFVTDGGLETSLIFHQGLDLPHFASFDLLKDDAGAAAIRAYFAPFLALARSHGVGMVLDTATWRANPGWGRRLGYSREELADANREAVALAEELRSGWEDERTPILLSGSVGPRGDGYVPGELMEAAAAEEYHAWQIGVLADAGVDLVTAYTLSYADEAIGIVRAAGRAGVPVAISFTVETDGRLPDGEALGASVERVDAETDGSAAYFMVNCAHPTHFDGVLDPGAPWLDRIRGLRANASTKSHAELDASDVLDDGDPVDLADRYLGLRDRLPGLAVLGGCCGTDHRHVDAIAGAWLGE